MNTIAKVYMQIEATRNKVMEYDAFFSTNLLLLSDSLTQYTNKHFDKLTSEECLNPESYFKGSKQRQNLKGIKLKSDQLRRSNIDLSFYIDAYCNELISTLFWDFYEIDFLSISYNNVDNFLHLTSSTAKEIDKEKALIMNYNYERHKTGVGKNQAIVTGFLTGTYEYILPNKRLNEDQELVGVRIYDSQIRYLYFEDIYDIDFFRLVLVNKNKE